MLFGFLAILGPAKLIDSAALLAGGIFMGVNFLLLSFGVAWMLTPLAGKGRVKAGIGLLVLKILIFLALLTTLFFRFELDAVSFALGFSTLILAIVLESVRSAVRVRA
ncbi:MAG: hypothetical protein ACREP3_13005 [Candidatus Binatia bacterium]